VGFRAGLGEEKNSQPFPGLEPPINQLVAQRYTTELSRLPVVINYFVKTGVKLTTHLHLVPRSKNAWSYTYTPPIRLHGVVLS
jgi:hypothetical protein